MSIVARRTPPRFFGASRLLIGWIFRHCRSSSLAPLDAERLKKNYRRVSRQPAASASSTEQNQRVPFEIFISIFAYQRLVG